MLVSELTTHDISMVFQMQLVFWRRSSAASSTIGHIAGDFHIDGGDLRCVNFGDDPSPGRTLAKLLLTLMLLPQILTGIGASVYLCIAPGGIYCFNTEPDSCSYCPKHACEQDAVDEELPCSCCGRKHPSEPLRVAGHSCGCEHILMSGGHSPDRVRSLSLADAEQLFALLDLIPLVPSTELFQPAICRSALPPDRTADGTFSLAALSTVVIRC